MPDIYDQHKAAFASASAYVVLNSAKELVATVAFKYPRDGAGRLYCYLHVYGTSMVRGHASGCGYDKHGASIAVAARKIVLDEGERQRAGVVSVVEQFKAALQDSGHRWTQELENSAGGFTVLQAV